MKENPFSKGVPQIQEQYTSVYISHVITIQRIPTFMVKLIGTAGGDELLT